MQAGSQGLWNRTIGSLEVTVELGSTSARCTASGVGRPSDVSCLSNGSQRRTLPPDPEACELTSECVDDRALGDEKAWLGDQPHVQ